VIVRISSAIVPSSKFAAYSEHLRSKAIPIYEAAAGLQWVAFLERPVAGYVDVVTISVWKSEQALARFVESKLSKDNPASYADVIQLDPRAYDLILSAEGRLQDVEGT
jgi:heme-degrading monooxygenase HmoA